MRFHAGVAIIRRPLRQRQAVCACGRHRVSDLLLFEAVRPIVLIDLFARLLTVATILATASGGLSATGRLTGALPPLHPNEIAFLAAIPMVYFIWRTANLDFNALRLAGIIALGIIIVLADSRTTFGSMFVAIALVVIRGSRNAVVKVAIVATMTVALVFLFSFTDVFKSLSDRGGTSPVDTLGSRTIAWDAVLHSAPGTAQMLFGKGLATKKVGVEGQWWTSQILDSLDLGVRAGRARWIGPGGAPAALRDPPGDPKYAAVRGPVDRPAHTCHDSKCVRKWATRYEHQLHRVDARRARSLDRRQARAKNRECYNGSTLIPGSGEMTSPLTIPE